jgi:hypothetical protein
MVDALLARCAIFHFFDRKHVFEHIKIIIIIIILFVGIRIIISGNRRRFIGIVNRLIEARSRRLLTR